MIINKDSEISIITPASPTTREIFAAEELKKYLGIIFGAFSDIIPEGASVKNFKILLGGPERNNATRVYISEADFDKSVPGPEGIIIKALNDDTLLIAGSSKAPAECERGTIYAVYEFIERYCGASLSAFSNPNANAGEYLPRLSELDTNNIEYIKSKADSPYRCAIVQYSNYKKTPDNKLNIPFFDWLAKNRYNRLLVWASTYQFYKDHGLIEEIEKRGITFTVGHHEASRLFIPPYGNEYFPEHYYETHPEYFKLLEDGKRFENINEWGQLVYCSRNEELIEVLSKNIISWLKQNPSVDIVALWPNDGIFPQCACENCRKYSKTENYSYFTNAVVKKVNEVFPHVKFDILIYVDLWECPDGTSLSDSVLIDESTWHSSGLRTVGKPDGSCLIGTFYEKNLLDWKKSGARVVYYDYYMGVYGGRQLVIPMADELQSLWKGFENNSIDGSGTQIECYNMWNHLLNFYSFARTGYDNSRSLLDNIKALCKIFGEGAEIIENIMQMSEECLDGQVEIKKCGHFLMKNLDTELLFSEFDRALSVTTDKRCRNNIRLLRMAYRYSYLETNDPNSENIGTDGEEYNTVEDGYIDDSGEMAVMTEFDSIWKNDPGYAITIPLRSEKTNFKRNAWYEFE